ncbi:hypothetical protein P4V43_24050 [Brevibacillus fortis]|nr:hypothetical protein [Brevibacillus fortis]
MIGRISGITGSIFKLGIVFSIYGCWMTLLLGPWAVRRLALWRLA